MALKHATSLRDINFYSPYGLCQVFAGTEAHVVVISDFWGHRLGLFTPGGQLIRTIGGRGTEVGQYRCPAGIVADDGDRFLFVAENGNNRIQKLSADDLTPLLMTGAEGCELGMLRGPTDLAITASSPERPATLFVSDAGNHRIVAYDTDTLAVLATFGSAGSADGHLRFPCGLAVGVDPSTSMTLLYVADGGNKRISVYRSDGHFVTSYSAPRTGGASASDGIPASDSAVDTCAEPQRPNGLLLLPEGLLVCEATELKLLNPADGTLRHSVAVDGSNNLQCACVVAAPPQTPPSALQLLSRPSPLRSAYVTDLTGDGKVHVIDLPEGARNGQVAPASPPAVDFSKLAVGTSTNFCRPETPLPPEAVPLPSAKRRGGAAVPALLPVPSPVAPKDYELALALPLSKHASLVAAVFGGERPTGGGELSPPASDRSSSSSTTSRTSGSKVGALRDSNAFVAAACAEWDASAPETELSA